jgi:lipopolysaccharide export system protein LptC
VIATASRPTTWLPFGVLVVIVAMTWWLNLLVQAPPAGGDGKARHDPDMLVNGFSATSYGVDGAVLYIVNAVKVVHYPDDDSAELTRLSFDAYQPGQPKVTVTSDRGRLLDKGSEVWFEGNVVLNRAADAAGRVEPLTMHTDRMQVLPDEKIARTASEIVVDSPSGRVVGTGFELNNEAKTMRLNKVRAVYQPPSR